MKLSMEWLSEFLDIGDVDIKQYCDRMTDTGTKVEYYEQLGGDISNVLVGEVTEIEKHPNADKLFVCKVTIGKPDLLQVVTGAQNLFVGAKVPVCVAPAVLPNDVKIKKGKLRGIESDGMFCSISELELTPHDIPYAVEDGILILNHSPENDDCKIGDDICHVLKLKDTVVDFEITPNRPDCLSIIGLARESGASFEKQVSYHKPVINKTNGDIGDYLAVGISAPDKCFRYTARVVKNVKIAPSPLWMRMRLRACGVRPINNIVDITNYVMLEYGQPMHAFDYVCIDGKKITVRNAEENENFKSLDDTDHVLNADMLVISDDTKAIALAGVMGGANSEIKDTTETVVFESANFLGSSVRVTSRSLGMRTESSGRFEKGLDPENTLEAVERACELVELLGAGDIVGGIIDVYPGKKSEVEIKLDKDKINAFLGTDFEIDYMKKILLSLEFGINGDTVSVPSYRGDVEIMNDLAEEVIRIYGYNNIKSTLFRSQVRAGMYTPRTQYKNRVSDLLCSLGYDEIYTFSFVSPKWYNKINMAEGDKRRNSVSIRNPLGDDTSVMRTTLLPSILEVTANNINNRNESASLYEIASVYLPLDNPSADVATANVAVLPDEHYELVLASYGGVDFYDMKSVIAEIFNDAGIVGYSFAADVDGLTYHPGRSASIIASDGEVLGIIGELHPQTAENYGIEIPVYAAELHFEKILTHGNFVKGYKSLPKYPAVTRDFAFICDEDTESAVLEKLIRDVGGKLIESIRLFDVYRGNQIDEGKKSMAYTVVLRAGDRTLTFEEADKTAADIICGMEKELNIKVRS